MSRLGIPCGESSHYTKMFAKNVPHILTALIGVHIPREPPASMLYFRILEFLVVPKSFEGQTGL